MKSEKLKRIEEIYHSALEIPPTERAAFLQKSCGTDEVLLREVESLLTFEESSVNFLNVSPESLVAEIFSGEDIFPSFIGAEIGHYKILQLLGRGGMGEVYLAEDIKLDRKAALKILPSEFADDEVRMSRFVREAKAVSALNHPNILTIYEIGEAENTHFIAAEFIKGKTLNEYTKNKSLDTKSALEIAVQIASALDEAHVAGIIHRDIKPDNVMIRDNGLVKLLDFGIAKLSEKGSKEFSEKRKLSIEDKSLKLSPRLFTNLGTIIGTADYMSPEQAEGKEVDARTDIFSFGVVLYQMLSGKLPFEGTTVFEMIDSILKNEPKSLPAEIPIEIVRVINRCLQKNRDERYQTIKEVLFDLEEIRKDLTFGETTQRTFHITNEITLSRQPQRFSSNNEIISGKQNSNKWLIGISILLLISIFTYFSYQFFTPAKQIKSIAVMPFVNESFNKDTEYLSDGMTETLIKRLSELPDLSIKARSTVFTYKEKNILPDKIGKELKVDAVLLGRMIQQGDDLKLHLELVETATQNVLWIANYDRKMNDLAKLQREIAGDVSQNLQLKLTTAEQRQVTKTYSNSSEAQQLYLRGRFHWNKRNFKDFELAIEYFKQAIEKDPNFALAYAGLADTYALIPLYGNFRPKDFMPLAKQSALKALELDENLAEAHASLGRILNSFDYDWEEAEREFIKSIKLNPNYPTVHQWYAELLAFRGRHDEALKEISKALELDPLSLTINRMKGNILSFANRQDEALAQLNKTVELYPENPIIRYNLGDAFAAKRAFAESVEQYIHAFKLEKMPDEGLKKFKIAFQKDGWQGFWQEYLKTQLESQKTILEKDKNTYFKNEPLAYAYAANNNKDKSFEYLNKAFDECEPELISIGISDIYGNLADDPRFKELIKKIGLPY